MTLSPRGRLYELALLDVRRRIARLRIELDTATAERHLLLVAFRDAVATVHAVEVPPREPRSESDEDTTTPSLTPA